MRFNPLALATVLAFAPCALAQNEAQNDSDTVEARVRFKEGVKAFEARKYEQARAAFKQAYALKAVPDILRNLGTAEIRAGYVRDGARHLSEFLRGAPTLSEAERKDIDKELGKAQSKLGRVLITVNVDDARVSVDDETVGPWVSSQPWYVEPGEHVVVAKKTGYLDARQTMQATAGQAATVTLPMQAEPQPTPAVAREPAQNGIVYDSPRADASIFEGRSLVPAIVGGSVVVLGIAGGIGFRMAASSKQDGADGLAHSEDSACYGAAAGSCAELREANQAVERNKNFSTASFVVAGASGVVTLGYYLFWPKSTTASGVRPAGGVATRGASVGIVGNF